MEYGLTDKGFVAKPFPVILEEEREAWKAAFGFEIDTSTETPEGAYIGVQAAKLTQLWEMMEGLFAAGDTDTASGVYLDRLCSLVNVERKPAESTRVYVALWGEQGTVINSGHLARMSISGDQFSLQENVTINTNRLLGFLIKLTKAIADLYTLSIDGRIISYTAQEDEDEKTIQAGIFEQIEAVFPGIFDSTNLGVDGLEVHVKSGIVPIALYCDDSKIEIVSLGALGIYRANVAGALFVGVGTLDTIVSNISGLDHIVNYATGITGREKESDAELRMEKNKRQKQASGNELAIQNEIEKVPGVLYCRVYSNRTRFEREGRPPNSYEAIVIGGVDHEIAEKILDKGPAGIQPFGKTVVTVQDVEGTPWEIGFSRPENQYIWIRIDIAKNLEEEFPINGIELLKANIVAWGASNMGVGIDFIFQRLNKPIYDVPGIRFADIKVAVTSDLTPPIADDYAAQNIVMSERQIAIIDTTRIIITELLDEI
jgi:uncharacterized phage protein gp47/JayE